VGEVKLSIPSLDKKLWKIVSEYIRRRDAGHFISRDRKSTKFLETNISAQCPRCNRFKSGNQFEHGKRIDERWGEGTANELLIKSKQPVRRKRFDYEYLIKEFKEKLKGLK